MSSGSFKNLTYYSLTNNIYIYIIYIYIYVCVCVCVCVCVS